MVFKVKKRAQENKYWLEEFQKRVDNSAGNQHIQFTAEIWTNDENLTLSTNKDKVQIVTKKSSFLDTKMSCPPEGDL